MKGSMIAAYSVRLLSARTHRHGPHGQAWVTYNDAVKLAHDMGREIEEKYGIKIRLDIPQLKITVPVDIDIDEVTA